MTLPLKSRSVSALRSDSGCMSEIMVWYKPSDVSDVRSANGDRSEIGLKLMWRVLNDIRPANGDTSAVSVLYRTSDVSDPIPASGDRSEMAPPSKSKPRRLMAYSIPVSCRTPCATNFSRVAISSRVMGSPSSLPNASPIARRRATSGISTVTSVVWLAAFCSGAGTVAAKTARKIARTPRCLGGTSLPILMVIPCSLCDFGESRTHGGDFYSASKPRLLDRVRHAPWKI